MGSAESSDEENQPLSKSKIVERKIKDRTIRIAKPIQKTISFSDSSDDNEKIPNEKPPPKKTPTRKKDVEIKINRAPSPESDSDKSDKESITINANKQKKYQELDKIIQQAIDNQSSDDDSDENEVVIIPKQLNKVQTSESNSQSYDEYGIAIYSDSEDVEKLEENIKKKYEIVDDNDDSDEDVVIQDVKKSKNKETEKKQNIYSEVLIDDAKEVPDYLFKQVHVPEIFKKYIQIQQLLNNLKADNLNTIVNEIISLTIDIDNLFEVFKLIHCFSKPRGKDSILFSQIFTKMVIAFGEPFKKIVVANAQGNILYQMYENGTITIDEIRKRQENFTDLVYFFLPELGITRMNSLKDSNHFSNIRKKINKLKENDWAIYKYMRKYGYEQNSVGLALKNDDIVLFKSLVKINPKNLTNLIQIGQFDGDSTLMTPICASAHYGSDDCFDFLLMQNVEIDSSAIKTCSFYGGSLHIVSALSRRGVDFSDMLRNASAEHRYELFNYLVESKADLNITYQSMINSENLAVFVYTMNNNDAMEFDADFIFRMAAIGGSLSVCKYLVDDGQADPNKKRGKEQKSLLISSSENGRSEIVSFLLTLKNIDIELRDRKGQTALHWACLKDHPECVKILLKNGANIEVRDEIGETPLIKAAQSGSVECASILLENGADINGQSFYRMTPLLVGARENNYDVCEFLTSKGADVTLVEKSSMSVLHYSANNLNLLKLFVRHGANVNYAMADGTKPIDWCETPACEKFLLNSGSIPKQAPIS